MMMMMMMMMNSSMCKTLTVVIICMALQHACGLPLSEPAEAAARTPAHLQHVRTKRCSCNSWDDKECIYFCHLDIIWVNTPSKLLPYGLGSPVSRRRRSAGRCKCMTPADKTCSSFCQNSAQNPRTDVVGASEKSENKFVDGNKLLSSFRSVVKANVDVATGILSSEKNKVSVKRLKSRTRRYE